MVSEGVDVAAALHWVEVLTSPVVRVEELRGGWTSTMLALATRSHGELVLRLMTREPWRTHGPSLTTREHEVQHALAATAVPAPRPVALDAEGEACGVSAHLMTRVPGAVDVDRVDPASLARLADVLAGIHGVQPTVDVRTFQSWAWQAKFVAPEWAADTGLWESAFDLLRTDPPGYEPRLIHRDFQHRNVLWSGDAVTGVVDWVETSIGPAWLDVAHCCTNIAIGHGSDRADAFATAYVERTGARPQSYFDVMDVVGFLPPPGRASFITAHDERERLEGHLLRAMRRVAS
ncbi:aminoglycoside phosphotransferase family protein [Nocardioides sp. 31GB23]|uniref:phosphotransferase family protein n=1 Tax=Nocardioides sp. 31GB23 TaxID=3156065 RepID=UPI0032AF7753